MPPFEPGHAKLGGRSAGTPNRSTQRIKDFFEDVLEKAFADPAFKPALVQSIVSLSIDTKLFIRILEYVGGKPDTNHKHGVDGSVEQLFEAILGRRLEAKGQGGA